MRVKIKTARKQFRCESCPKPILAGETYTQSGKKRRHLNHGEPARPTVTTVAELSLAFAIEKKPVYDQRVQMSTGHPQYPNRTAEARFILDCFERNYKKSQLKKGLRGKVLKAVKDRFEIFPPQEVTPELIFQLRTVYHRSKKLMDGGNA